MFNWLTESGAVHCLHPGAGEVAIAPGSHFVRIAGAAVHVEPNPLARPVNGCGHPASTNSKPCTGTLSVSAGYSTFVRIAGSPVCLSTVSGLTDSVPPSTYAVSYAGQALVRSR